MKKTLLLLSISSLIFYSSCRPSPQKEPPETPSEVLNEFVRSAPVQFINLDEVETQIIELSEENIIYSILNDPKEGEPLISRMRQIALVSNQFLVYDWAKVFYFISDSGKVTGPVTRLGRGPGEHSYVAGIATNSEYIYLADSNNGRINIYNHKMEYVDALSHFTFGENLSASGVKIYLDNFNSFGFQPAKPDEGRILVSSVNSLKDTLHTFMPRIIPAGYQPQNFNRVIFSINEMEDVAASYAHLPWIFLFDEDHSLEQTLILEYSFFDEMNFPSMELFKPIGNEGSGGSNPYHFLKLLNNGDLIFPIRKELIHLSKKGSNNYQLAGKYQVIYPANNDTMFFASVISLDQKNAFAANSWDELFTFVLP